MNKKTTEFATRGIQDYNKWDISSIAGQVTPESVMVFRSGTRRYAVIVCPRGDSVSQLTRADAHWELQRRMESGREHFFCDLQWATEIRGSDCILLIGKEILTQFNITA